MYVLTSRGWKNEFLAYHLHDEEIRIVVQSWFRVYSINDAFIAYDRKDWRKAIDYVRKIGFKATLRKIISRRAERDRNRKFVAIGWGEVLEIASGCDQNVSVGAQVGFIAPFHPECVDEICLDYRLVRELPCVQASVDPAAVITCSLDPSTVDWTKIAGWSRWSGRELDQTSLRDVFDRMIPSAAASSTTPPVRLPVVRRKSQTFVSGQRHQRPGHKQAVIFGMGQYAKTAIAPYIGKYVDIACWHEIDPTQIGPVGKQAFDLRTSMLPCADEHYDVYFVAGFHHTHVPVALKAIGTGADLVVEKPLATTHEQLTALLKALSTSKSRYFAGFHKRYNPLNALIREDVGKGRNLQISYRAIVYEIPLPANHWYRWPNSRGRIVSNGCHWIDHFLFLNDFCEPSRIQAHQLGNGDVLILIDLKNGASASILITEHGSSRLGVRETLWLTSEDRTATIIDDRRYSSESSRKFLRKLNLRAQISTHRMYDEIGRRLVRGGAGDTIHSIKTSTETMLQAEDGLIVST